MGNILYEQIAEVLEKGINDGKYKVGEKLPSERDLSTQFNVSRNIIREAVKLLKEKGLVKVLQGKGSYVTLQHSEGLIGNIRRIMKSNNGTLEDIMEIRGILEESIVSFAVDRATKEQIELLETIVEQMSNEIEYSNEFTKLDLEFHISLAKCTNNPLFLELMNSLYVILDESIKVLMVMYPQTKEIVIRQHTQIIAAIKNKDKTLAKQLMHKHLLYK